jgi:hypothetical protein
LLHSSRKFTALFCALPFFAASARAQPPAITSRGIVNAASQIPPSLPGGMLAPGMEVLIQGVRFVSSGSETTVRLEHGSWQSSVKPTEVMPRMLKARLPQDTPLGEIAISVMNGEGTSRPEHATVIASSPGIETLNGEGWGPAFRVMLAPGEQATLQVNGLNEKLPSVFVGGIQARKINVKGGRVTFRIPLDTPQGCWTPAWIRSASGSISNFVTIAIRKGNGVCEQAPGWFARVMPDRTRTGLLVLERISGSVEETGKPQSFAFDSGAAFFYQASRSKLVPLQLLPPAGSCTTYTSTFSFDAASLLDLQQFIGSAYKLLHAGPSVIVEAKDGLREVLKSYGRSKESYTGFFGGTLPIMWGPGTDLVLKPGTYSIQTEGGEGVEVGKMNLTVTVPDPFEWTNASAVETIDRKNSLTLQWKNSAPDRRMMAMAFSVDQETGAMGSLVCVASPKAAKITIPSYAFANFPATSPTGNLPLRFILLASMPAVSPEQPPPAGLDDARAIFLEIQGKTVRYR